MNPIYAWQGVGYMWLWEDDFFELAYCLLNTPEHLIAKEIEWLIRDFTGTPEELEEAKAEVRHNHIYDDKPIEERLKIYRLERNTELEEKIVKYVTAAREYLNNFGKSGKEEEVEDEE
jgi:hypothetical protein